jgi:hypothetical protein
MAKEADDDWRVVAAGKCHKCAAIHTISTAHAASLSPAAKLRAHLTRWRATRKGEGP